MDNIEDLGAVLQRLPPACLLFQRVHRRELTLRCATDDLCRNSSGSTARPPCMSMCSEPIHSSAAFSRHASCAAVNLNAISSLLASVPSDDIECEPGGRLLSESMLVQVVENLEACSQPPSRQTPRFGLVHMHLPHSSKRAISNGHSATDMKAEESVVNLSS